MPEHLTVRERMRRDLEAHYAKVNETNFKITDWLVETGICPNKIDAVNYLKGPAGDYVRESYLRAKEG